MKPKNVWKFNTIHGNSPSSAAAPSLPIFKILSSDNCMYFSQASFNSGERRLDMTVNSFWKKGNYRYILNTIELPSSEGLLLWCKISCTISKKPCEWMTIKFKKFKQQQAIKDH